MENPSKHIDKEAVEDQGISPNEDPGAIPTPHSLPVSHEFEEVMDQQDDETGNVQDLGDNVSGQSDEVQENDKAP
jgi:hypothetical protein